VHAAGFGSVYGALVAGAEAGVTARDNIAAFSELGFAPHVAGLPATWLTGTGAEAAACDATSVPVVTGTVDWQGRRSI
jgi:hypothetical protein